MLNLDSLSKCFHVELDEETQINLDLYNKVKLFGQGALELPYELLEDFMIFERAGQKHGTK